MAAKKQNSCQKRNSRQKLPVFESVLFPSNYCINKRVKKREISRKTQISVQFRYFTICFRYFNSSVAVPMLISYMVYQRPLPKVMLVSFSSLQGLFEMYRTREPRKYTDLRLLKLILIQNAVDVLVKEHMPKKAKRRGYSSWFSWRSPPEHVSQL